MQRCTTNTSTSKIINRLKEQGLNEKDFMASLFIPTILDTAQTNHPWLRNVLSWLQNNLPITSTHASINHGDYHPKNVMYASGHITGIIDWSFSIGDPAFDVGHTITLIMDIIPNIRNDCTLEIASKNNEQYRDAYQSIRSIDDRAVTACRASQCTAFLLHCLSGKKTSLLHLQPCLKASKPLLRL